MFARTTGAGGGTARDHAPLAPAGPAGAPAQKRQKQAAFVLPGGAALHRVIRMKGVVWLACSTGHVHQGFASLAGRHFTLAVARPWWATIERSRWPDGAQERLAEACKGPWGDRHTELVIIGQDLDHAAVTAALEACLLSDTEMQDYFTACVRESLPSSDSGDDHSDDSDAQ